MIEMEFMEIQSQKLQLLQLQNQHQTTINTKITLSHYKIQTQKKTPLLQMLSVIVPTHTIIKTAVVTAYGEVIQAPPLLTFMTMVGQETIGDGTIIGTGTLGGAGTHGMAQTGAGVGIIGTAQTGVGVGIIGTEIPGVVDFISRTSNSTTKEQEVLLQLTTTKITVEIDTIVEEEIMHQVLGLPAIITAGLETTEQSEIRDQALISGHQEIQSEIAQT